MAGELAEQCVVGWIHVEQVAHHHRPVPRAAELGKRREPGPFRNVWLLRIQTMSACFVTAQNGFTMLRSFQWIGSLMAQPRHASCG
jgi:hypothetical protein